MEDLIKRKPKWRRGAPDEKIDALVIFFPDLSDLLVMACEESEEGC